MDITPGTETSEGKIERHVDDSLMPVNSILEAATVGILLGGLLVGFLLYMFGKLPTHLAVLGSTLTAALTLIVSSWSKIDRSFFQPFRRNWRFPHSLVSLIIGLVGIALIFSWLTVGRADPYVHVATPAFSDSLTSGSNDNYWVTGTYDTGDCEFNNQSGLLASTKVASRLNVCQATTTDFSDFVYEVQMNLIRGDCGGILFRADPDHGKFYDFEVCSDRSYAVNRWDGFNQSADSLRYNPSKQLRGVDITKTITIALVARDNHFDLYVNHHYIDLVFDTNSKMLREGEIGVAVDTYQSKETVAEFTNAKVWTF